MTASLFRPTLAGLDALVSLPPAITVSFDWSYAGTPTRALLHALDLNGEIARTGVPDVLQAGQRWVVERTQS